MGSESINVYKQPPGFFESRSTYKAKDNRGNVGKGNSEAAAIAALHSAQSNSKKK